ncbi:MAG: nucleotidyl transferase AbiEii/AbiGii toxin family protein [Planctomycetota bacterium]|nr:nucleotidyl transferase AbiEii/AbiGii toxin family protein [Planctomycetota bacterium]
MNKRTLRNLPASVRARLLKLSVERQQDFQLVLLQYAVERLLYRLASSPHANKFVLKGAMLFAVWSKRTVRATRDLDLLGYGEATAEHLLRVFRDVCRATVEPDGLDFDANSINVVQIREDQEYGGLRVTFVARLERALIPVQVDVGFGDAVTPAPQETEFPCLLEFPAARIRAYTKETVVAEKLDALVKLGMDNSRMKDFYDLWILSRESSFSGKQLAAAVRATFERRKTGIPTASPLALTSAFATNPDKVRQWTAFLRRTGLSEGEVNLAKVIGEIASFLVPVLNAVASRRLMLGKWQPGGPWGTGTR